MFCPLGATDWAEKEAVVACGNQKYLEMMEVEIYLSFRSLQLWICPRRHWLLQVKEELEGQDGPTEVEKQEERGELSLIPYWSQRKARDFLRSD